MIGVAPGARGRPRLTPMNHGEIWTAPPIRGGCSCLPVKLPGSARNGRSAHAPYGETVVGNFTHGVEIGGRVLRAVHVLKGLALEYPMIRNSRNGSPSRGETLDEARDKRFCECFSFLTEHGADPVDAGMYLDMLGDLAVCQSSINENRAAWAAPFGYTGRRRSFTALPRRTAYEPYADRCFLEVAHTLNLPGSQPSHFPAGAEPTDILPGGRLEMRI